MQRGINPRRQNRFLPTKAHLEQAPVLMPSSMHLKLDSRNAVDVVVVVASLQLQLKAYESWHCRSPALQLTVTSPSNQQPPSSLD